MWILSINHVSKANYSLPLHFSSPDEFFITGPYENHPSKIFAVCFSFALILVTSPINIIIVNYERDKSNRTLINQLLSSLIICNFFLSLFLQFSFCIRYIFGPVHEILCYLDLMLIPGTVMLHILFLDAIYIVRYIFIFHTRNPTVSQDDFWNCFLCIWMAGACFITHLVFMIMPGNNPNYFYICLGKIPRNYYNEKTKVNYSLQFILLFSFLVHILGGVRYLVFKLKEKKNAESG